jgi:predicted ATP-dependent endonuclease of OLD family
MRIQKIKINQYKSIINMYIDDVNNINILIGPNNSGKSNLLDAIESLFLPTNQDVIFEDKESDYEIEIFLNADDKSFLKTSSNILLAKRQGNEKKYFLDNKEISNIDNLIIFFDKRFVRYDNKLLQNLDKIREDYRTLKTNHPVAFKKLMKFFNSFFPDIAEIISLEQSDELTNRLHSRLKKGDKVIEYARLGSGVRRIFAIMLYYYHPEYFVILVNEPETKLHPALIGKIRDFILSTENSYQSFITTHSPIFVTPTDIRYIFKVSKDKNHLTRFDTFSKNDYIDTNRLVQEFDADNLEIFFADKAILVEGVSDKILLKGLIKKYYQGRKEVKVISVSGKSNIGIYIKLMTIFKIDYLVLLDRDALTGIPIKDIQQFLPRRHSGYNKAIETLKEHKIFILPNGTIEKNYPRKYQRKDTKPLNALYALSQISDNDYYSSTMKYLREFINNI